MESPIFSKLAKKNTEINNGFNIPKKSFRGKFPFGFVIAHIIIPPQLLFTHPAD